MDKSLTRSVFLTAALLLAPLISNKAVGQDAGMDRPVEVVQSKACSHLNTSQRADLNQSSVAAIAMPAA
jgi:hypothetical protein